MMKRVGIYYIMSFFVFVASVTAACLLPVADWLKNAFAFPGIAALFGALFQIVRDQARFEKEHFLQKDQQIFNLGAASHMAAVAFDKHVQFCEEYMSHVHDVLDMLYREGPTEKAREDAKVFFNIRRRFEAWIPKTVTLNLEPFEKTLLALGVVARTAESPEYGENRRFEAGEEAHELYTTVLNLKELDKDDPERTKTIENVKEQLRVILGIDELMEIRSFIIQKSAEFIRKNG